MAKPRASTIQQRFGFQDGDLKKPKHDNMMLWLDESIEVIVKRLTGWKNTWDADKIANWKARALTAVNQEVTDRQKRVENTKKNFGSSPIDKYWQDQVEREEHYLEALHETLHSWQLGSPGGKPPLQINKMWEYAIRSGKYVIGFVDMKVTYKQPILCVEGIEARRYSGGWKLNTLEKLPSWGVGTGSESTIFLEVKTAIPSLGELIRQIRMYQEYVRSPFYVVSPDAQFKDTLHSQGIGFVHYPSGEI